MEEEWMRDRALLLDLLKKDPQATPQELAQLTGRQVELGQEMAKAPARRQSPRSFALVFPVAGPPCPLFPLGPTSRNPHPADADLSARASRAHSWSPSPALLPPT